MRGPRVHPPSPRWKRRAIAAVLVVAAFGSAFVATASAIAAIPGPPKAETLAGTQLTSSSAQLNAVVSSFGAETLFCSFEYGVAPSLSQTAPCGGPPASELAAPVSAVVSGLAPATEYAFRILFTTVWPPPEGEGAETGTAVGAIVRLRTLPGSEVPYTTGPSPTPTSTQAQPPNPPAPVGPTPQPPSRIVCAGAGDGGLRIPAGYVVVAFLHAQRGCGADRYGYGFNAEEIQQAANGIDACVGNNISNPGIPGNFVVTRIWHKPSCGNDRAGYDFNADEIHAAANGVDACVGYDITNRIPAGFAVIRWVTKSGCGPAGRGYNALEIGAT